MTSPLKYNDRPFRLVAAIVGAYFVSEFGGTDGYFSLRRVLSRDFYIEYGCTLIIALILIELIASMTRVLDRVYDWEEQPAARIGLQAAFGVALPSLVDVLLATLYFSLFGVNILETAYLRYALPYIVLKIVLFNLYYVIFYFYLRAKVNGTLSERTDTAVDQQVEKKEEKRPKEVFIVNRGPKSILVYATNICYFFHKNGQNFLQTFDDDAWMVYTPLDVIEREVDSQEFFRLNRQLIINRRTCTGLEPLKGGKIKAFLSPDSPVEHAFVSRKKARRFREWLKRG